MMADLSATRGCRQIQLAQAMEIHDTIEIIPTCPNLLAPLFDEDVLKAAKEKIESDISGIKSKIHRFPPSLRGFGRDRDYIAPWTVAIGPYYHSVPKLQAMEEVKRMAVYCFCDGFPVACDVRGCYADADALEGITDDDFAAMMFLDGCFLVQFIISEFSAEWSLMRSVIASKVPGNIQRDIMLLENQIPWRVLQLLTALRPAPMRDFICHIMSRFRVGQRLDIDEVNIDKDFKPAHLLGLIHFYQVRRSFVEKHKFLEKKKRVKELPYTSAAQLAEIGVMLTSSGMTQISEMEVVRGPLFGTLSLAPLRLGVVSTGWLVNMVAFELCTGTGGKFDYPVNSYLAVLAQLMHRDDDVREMRGKGILHATLDYHQTLKFFNHLSQHLRSDLSYTLLFQGLEEYKQKRWVCIAIHKFLYNNFKIIATVLSIAGVLVGIFKALLSLKQHQP